ncbi:MAG: hypothetical protein KJN72_12160 [Woeseia sp.]|nr:hypothetical protein [Woeseia sp.]
MNVRTKFTCDKIKKEIREISPGNFCIVRTIWLTPIAFGDEVDVAKFWGKHSPAGRIKFEVEVGSDGDCFELGADYYFEISQAMTELGNARDTALAKATDKIGDSLF